MGLKLANNATSTLASSITNSATTLSVQVADASKFPTLAAGDWFPITIVDAAGNMEIMKVTARAAANLTVVRGQEGTSGLAFSAGSRVDLRVTNAALTALETADAIANATPKALPVDADKFAFRDSVGGGFAALTWANIKAALLNTFTAVFPRVDVGQSFTLAQQGQGRANIGAGLMAGFRNQLINGDHRIRQRGTSFSIAPGTSKITSDRWNVYNGTDQTATVTILDPNPNFFGQLGHPGYLAVSFTVAPILGSITVFQHVENVMTLAGEQATVIAYFGANVGTPAAAITMAQHFGVGGSALVSIAPSSGGSGPVSSAEIRGLFNIPSVAGKTIGSGNFLQCIFAVEPRTTSGFLMTHASLVKGNALAEADPFSPRHVQQEVAMCQRYYQSLVFPNQTLIEGNASINGSYTTTQFAMPVSMRATPTITPVWDAGNESNVTTKAMRATNTTITLDIRSSTVGRYYASPTTVVLDAEL